MNQTIEIQESLQPGFRVDRESKTIFDVCLLGPESRNGWKYSAKLIQESAGKYDKKPVYLNHVSPGGKRDVRDVAGRIASPRLRDGRLFGDIKAIGRNGDMLLDLAESDVDGIGMSHIAEDSSVRGKQVLSIGKIKSVDVVDNPATTKTLREETLELKEKLSSLLEGKKSAVERLKAIYEACEIEFKADDQELPVVPLIEDVDALREYAVGKPALVKLIEQYDGLQKDKWIAEAIAETKVPDTEATRKAFAKCATKELMVEHGKVLKEAIEAMKPVPGQKGREPAKTGLTVDAAVAAFKSMTA